MATQLSKTIVAERREEAKNLEEEIGILRRRLSMAMDGENILALSDEIYEAEDRLRELLESDPINIADEQAEAKISERE